MEFEFWKYIYQFQLESNHLDWLRKNAIIYVEAGWFHNFGFRHTKLGDASSSLPSTFQIHFKYHQKK
jgi:hypothetical protein